ncbi:acyltransferase family protein [Carboxylicivirga caseinilyticus]|uniref:acyltransferase family protein n=1 Tax=Carboxylicivirga caseinilyticus TaxID=3417572 RepID=UPI003D337AA7|nr:acyltransferase [Marinilabiliaceae bacterium A049]
MKHSTNNKPIFKPKRTFYPELESLRALAVLMVLMAHFIPKNSIYYVPYMWYGVDLFFTISGFLITSILLKAKLNKKEKNGRLLKNFYIRRALRLFPIYYLFIMFFYLAKHLGNLHMWNDDYNFYFFTYFQNLYFFKIGNFNSLFSHLWSLGVEEQFYLIWPFLILFLPKKVLPFFFSGIIVLSLGLNTIYSTTPMFRNLTFANFHTLGIGALFAFYHVHKQDSQLFKAIVKNRTLITAILLPIMILVLTQSHYLGYTAPFILELFLALTTVSFVLTATYGWQWGINKVTHHRALMHIGKISYGIYLFHLPLPALTKVLVQKTTGFELNFKDDLWSFVVFTIMTIVLAHVSFRFIETPFLKLKTNFD